MHVHAHHWYSYFLFIRGFLRSKVSTSKVRNASFLSSQHILWSVNHPNWTWFPSLEIIYKSVIRFQILKSSGARIKTSVTITKCAIVLIFKRNFLTNESYCTICQEKGDRLQIAPMTLQFRGNLNQSHEKVDVDIFIDSWLFHSLRGRFSLSVLTRCVTRRRYVVCVQ